MAIFLAGKTVHDFIQRAVAAAGDDEMAAFVMGALRDFGGIAGLGGLGELCLDATSGKNAAGFIEHGTAAMPAVAGVGIVNQQRIIDFRGHPSFTSCSQVIGPSRFLPSSFYIMLAKLSYPF